MDPVHDDSQEADGRERGTLGGVALQPPPWGR
jgi:hypothetical protein